VVLIAAASVADWLIAVGTIGAVLVALFLQVAIPYWRRPTLVILPGTIPESVTDTDEQDVEGEWWDIPVTNDGRGDAIGAQVLLTHVSTGDGTKTRVPLRSLKWTHFHSGIADIPAGITRSVELGHIKPIAGGPLSLGIYPPLGESERGELQRDAYQITFAVVASNARARYFKLDLRFDESGLSFPDGVLASARPRHSR
jgi:hypothetical protein